MKREVSALDNRDMVEFDASEEEHRKLYHKLQTEDPQILDNNDERRAEKNPVGNAAKKRRNDREPETAKMPWPKAVIYYLHDVVYLLATIIIVFLMLFRVVIVSGTSMNNTLMDGDILLLMSNTFYKNPTAGDIIVASKDTFDNGAPIVKRVIATEGQTVDIDFGQGIVYVDGVALKEPYILSKTTLYEGVNFPLIVEPGCVFVLGDNRDDSKDSRSPEIGQIDTRQIVGKVVFLFLPGTNRGVVDFDFGRIGVVS